MKDDTLWWLVGAGIVTYLILSSEEVGDYVTQLTQGWQAVEQGPVWVPVINQSEAQYGIPTNLLARMAYEESHFRPEIINGTLPSSAGALGILQLMPQFFSTVNAPIPFQQSDVLAQISQAAQQLAALYKSFDDWGVAVAAYNAGAGTMQNVLAGTAPMPSETRAYVSDILTDIPLPTQLAV
jgi:soluble lytic murein transglycosylase-like protein